MNILILGGGGREHALGWAVAQNPKCEHLYAAPGNPGLAQIADCVDLDILDGAAVVVFARDHAIDLVIIGPEAPLVAGVADHLRMADIAVFGPSAAAAKLEASKSFTKEICAAANVPTARSAYFTAAAPARAYAMQQGAPIVVKADGLAAGKGVVVATDLPQALDAIEAIFDGGSTTGASVLIEEFMAGEEASLFVLCDGHTSLICGTAQDHKRVFDDDKGPNTGGMGAYSPAPIVTQSVLDQAMAEIVQPTLDEMAARATPYHGVLYAGLMIENGRARLVEYNARFGDPEAQVLMMRLGAQALDLIHACAQERLADISVAWGQDHAMTVVMAAQGYPGPYETGMPISGLTDLPLDSSHMVFHAGTKQSAEQLVSAGGRVLSVTARGADLPQAAQRAYHMANQIQWPGVHFRRDIGWRAL